MTMATIVKGEERGRPGKWIVDYRDVTGRRKWITKDTREEAKRALGEILSDVSVAGYCQVSPDITLAEYGDRLIKGRAGFVKPRTVEANREGFQRIKTQIGSLKVRDVTPGIIIRLLEQLKTGGLANGTVRYSLEVLNVVLNRARVDGVIAHNPAQGLGKQVRLQRSREAEEIKALTIEQRAAFIEASRLSAYYALYQFLLGTGARVGEALALRVNDISGRSAVIDETLSAGQTGTPKSGQARTVDLTADLAVQLRQYSAKQAERHLAHGRAVDFLFADDNGVPIQYQRVRHDFQRVLQRAGLPAHFTLHCTRHTYATLLLSNGENIQYVQQQLGHTSITLTVDVYGKWLPLKGSGVQERVEHGGQEISGAAHTGSRG